MQVLNSKLLGTSHLRIAGAARRAAVTPYCSRIAAEGDFAITQPTDCSPITMPIQVAKVIRVVYEDKNPYVVVLPWQCVHKRYKYKMANPFAALTQTKLQIILTQEPLVDIKNVLVWSITLEPTKDNEWGGVCQTSKVPFSASHYLHDNVGVDLATDQYNFSKLGKMFYREVHGC